MNISAPIDVPEQYCKKAESLLRLNKPDIVEYLKKADRGHRFGRWDVPEILRKISRMKNARGWYWRLRFQTVRPIFQALVFDDDYQNDRLESLIAALSVREYIMEEGIQVVDPKAQPKEHLAKRLIKKAKAQIPVMTGATREAFKDLQALEATIDLKPLLPGETPKLEEVPGMQFIKRARKRAAFAVILPPIFQQQPKFFFESKYKGSSEDAFAAAVAWRDAQLTNPVSGKESQQESSHIRWGFGEFDCVAKQAAQLMQDDPSLSMLNATRRAQHMALPSERTRKLTSSTLLNAEYKQRLSIWREKLRNKAEQQANQTKEAENPTPEPEQAEPEISDIQLLELMVERGFMAPALATALQNIKAETVSIEPLLDRVNLLRDDVEKLSGQMDALGQIDKMLEDAQALQDLVAEEHAEMVPILKGIRERELAMDTRMRTLESELFRKGMGSGPPSLPEIESEPTLGKGIDSPDTADASSVSPPPLPARKSDKLRIGIVGPYKAQFDTIKGQVNGSADLVFIDKSQQHAKIPRGLDRVLMNRHASAHWRHMAIEKLGAANLVYCPGGGGIGAMVNEINLLTQYSNIKPRA